MSLSLTQLQTLKAAIAADPALNSQPNGSDGNAMIAAAFNIGASPEFIIWRSDVPVAEVMQNGFDWTRVDNLSVGKARIWDWMTQFGSFDPSRVNIRAGIDATWVGTAADLAVRAAVYVHCKRAATRGEKLYSTGTGSDASPATLDASFGGQLTVSASDVDSARNLPE